MAELSVNVTPRAAQQIKAQLSKRPQSSPASGVRLGVKGGGDDITMHGGEAAGSPTAQQK